MQMCPHYILITATQAERTGRTSPCLTWTCNERDKAHQFQSGNVSEEESSLALRYQTPSFLTLPEMESPCFRCSGWAFVSPGRLANNQDKRAQPSEALYFPNSPNCKDVESSRPEILLNVSTGTSWTVKLFQAVVCFNCIEEFKVGWLTWPC